MARSSLSAGSLIVGAGERTWPGPGTKPFGHSILLHSLANPSRPEFQRKPPSGTRMGSVNHGEEKKEGSSGNRTRGLTQWYYNVNPKGESYL